jgi:plastocyanin
VYRKLLYMLTMFCIVSLVLVACGGDRSDGGAANSGSAATTGNQAHMNDSLFVQSSITIKKGESVTLVSDTFTPHIIANGTWDNGQARPEAEAGAPAVKNVQVNGNSSSTVGPFTTAGTFHLYCTIHPGMNLTVVVQ